MTFFLKSHFYRLIGGIAEKIIAAEDYFCDLKRVTLSEWGIFLINCAWFFPFLVFDIGESGGKSFQAMYSESFWTWIFGSLFIAHVAGFVLKSIRLRYWVIRIYAARYFAWTVISLSANPRSVLWEMCFVLTIWTVALAVRVHNESLEKPNDL